MHVRLSGALLVASVAILAATSLSAFAYAQDAKREETSGQRKSVIQEGDRMLFIGNSYMANEGGVFNYLKKALLTADGMKIHTDERIYYGKPLRLMLTEEVRRAVKSDDYDSVVITSGQLGTMKRIDSQITVAKKKTIVFMTWSGLHPGHKATKDGYTTATRQAVAVMRQMERETGASIVPIAVVYHDLTLRPPAGVSRVDYLWQPGNIHQNELGTMVNTWMMYAVLTGKSPVGVDFDMPPLVQGETLKNNPGISFDAEFRKKLQERVWQVAQKWNAGKTHLE